jgi:hypothetical protein
MEKNMRGQWIGQYFGSHEGTIIVNIDELLDSFEGTILLLSHTPNIVNIETYFNIQDKTKKQICDLTAFANAIHPTNYNRHSWADIKEIFPADYFFPEKIQLSIHLLEKNTLSISAKSEDKFEIESNMKKNKERISSLFFENPMSWDQFKKDIEKRRKIRFIYRGQKEPWCLKTSFHRHKRYRINEFIVNDIKQMHRRLSALTNHFFNLSNPEENGAFFNLLQHHGYPTPLLDWSNSPYVAAFFAFRDRPINYSNDGNVRIYIFNEPEWRKDFNQIQNLNPPFLHLSVIEFIALNNPRLMPQQSVTTVTNIDDIESYILEKQAINGKKYLEVIDIPAKQREKAMQDLRFMGITAGSMFPGIEGVCEEMKENNFDR